MRNAFVTLSKGVLGLGLVLISFASTAAGPGKDNPADILKVRNVEITFHQSGSSLPQADLNLMMSLYADDAVLTDTAHDNKNYTGKDQVRAYFSKAAPFQPGNHLIGYTPAMRIRATVDGDKATLYFECLWVDADKNAIFAHSFSNMTLARSGDGWLVKTIKVGKIDKL